MLSFVKDRALIGRPNAPDKLACHFHAVPFQRNTRAFSLPPKSLVPPTAHAFRADVAVTPRSKAPPAGLGLGTRVHALPFQCKISVFGLMT